MQQRSKIKTVSENGGGGLGRTVEGGWGEQWRKRGWGYARKLRLRTPTFDASPLALGSVSGDVDGNSCLDTFFMSYYVSKMYFLINTPKALFTYYSTVILGSLCTDGAETRSETPTPWLQQNRKVPANSFTFPLGCST